ncbi:MAG: hypothetical protein ACXW1Z_24365, partial [Methylobacter sp.]
MALGVTVDFNANIARFTSQIDRISGDLNRFQQHAETASSRVGKAFSAIGAGLSIAAVTAFVKEGIDAADALNDMSLKTGIAVEKLAGFQLATKQSGTDMDAFTSAANKLSVNIAKNSEEFAKLGIAAKDPGEAFLQLASVFSSIEDPQQRAALGARALGKSWQDMAPLLSQGGAALRASVAEGAKLSGVTEQMAKDADAFNDSLEVMMQRINGLSVSLAGPVISAFNNLYSSISNATEAGVTFNNVMAGLGNAFMHRQSFSGVAGQLQQVNDQIAVTEKKVNALQNNGIIGGLLDDLAGNDINLEKNRLDGLYKAQEKLANQLKESLNPAASAKLSLGPTNKDVADFIGGGNGGSKHAGSSRVKQQKTEVDQLQKSYESMLSSLEKEIDLRDKTSEVAKVEYEIISGSLKGLGPLQQQNLLGLAQEKDALERQEKQWAALVESANDYYDLRKSNDDLINSGDIQSGFNDALAKTQDQLKLGTISADQAKKEFDKLGTAWNDEFIAPATEGTDQLSQFAIQASRNMQDAFASFLFDPFQGGLTGMLDGFITTLRKMAAEAAAAMIFDSLKKNGGSWLDSLVGVASTAVSVAAAKGEVFSGGNLVPFATGGVVTMPTTFPMSGGQRGLMGE